MYKILIVDDDSISLAIAIALLESEYKVETAKSSVEAIGCLNSGFDPDIILLDMMMPGTNGMEFLKILKEEEAWRDIPVIFASAMDDHQTVLDGLKSGAVDFFGKPLNEELIILKLKRQIDIIKLKRENEELKLKLKDAVGQKENR